MHTMTDDVLYLDTSAWAKLFLKEAEKETVKRLMSQTKRVATLVITYTELIAGLAKAECMGRITQSDKKMAMEAAESDLDSFLLITPTLALCKRAANLANRFGLRGYDSVHLAAAEALMIQVMPQKIIFASYDDALNRAASALGLDVLA
jgi:predicted nucleic acid-binding protein